MSAAMGELYAAVEKELAQSLDNHLGVHELLAILLGHGRIGNKDDEWLGCELCDSLLKVICPENER